MIRSCGVIPIRNDQGILRYLLIQHRKGRHWGFPKGHVEPGETDEQTARRELREEAGIVKILLIHGYTTKDQYVLRTPNGKKPKEVTYFVGLTRSAHIAKQAAEIIDAHWFDYVSARHILANPSARRVLERTQTYLMTHQKAWKK